MVSLKDKWYKPASQLYVKWQNWVPEIVFGHCLFAWFWFFFFLKGSRHLQSLPECTELCTSASPAKDSFFSCPSSTSSLTGASGIICSTAENALWQPMCPSVSKKIPKLKCMTWRAGRKFLTRMGCTAESGRFDMKMSAYDLKSIFQD